MGSLFEMHFHTQETSPCGVVPAKDSVKAYKDAGYDGIVVTDHYFDGYFEKILPDMPWTDKTDRWLQGYRNAKAAGDACGLTVLLGMELRFSGEDNDYLVYGLTESLLREYPRLYQMNPVSFSDFARKQGLWWAQAHPFRPWLTRCDPQLLDGVEVHNGNPCHDSHNDLAAAWARENGLPGIAGSDFHEWMMLARAGVRFRGRVDSQSSLLAALKNGEYELVVCPENKA